MNILMATHTGTSCLRRFSEIISKFRMHASGCFHTWVMAVDDIETIGFVKYLKGEVDTDNVD